MDEYYARSGKNNVPPQPYREHILGTIERCYRTLLVMLQYLSGTEEYKQAFQCSTLLGTEYHDLGKLDDDNQKVLSRQNKTSVLPFRHEDAGCALLMKHFTAAGLFPLYLVYSHHQGIPNQHDENRRGDYMFRRYHKNDPCGEKNKEHIDRQLETYWKIHRYMIHEEIQCHRSPKCEGLALRLALSCLADADHGNAASWGHNATEKMPPDGRWTERLEALDQYIAKMDNATSRSQDRNVVYHACRDLPLDEGKFETCSSPVGTGKTTAVMAKLLRYAIKYNLRHIIVVLPFTNIIQQSVEVYRKALVLPGENPEEVVAEHHHLADFSTPEFRSFSTLWRTPIIVTTAVQFFETLGSNNPARLRKLHELPGSAIFVDEAHTAMPLELWPQVWKWLSQLAKKWCCPVILGSGSLRKFWENAQFLGEAASLPDVLPQELRVRLLEVESSRVTFRRETQAWGLDELKARLLSDHGGSKLVVVNTVHTAASLAWALREAGAEVLHLSTALTPCDRAKIMEQIKKRLNPNDCEYRDDWILVATSCVETGVNFSFAKGYRECCSVANLIQISGRINRHFERLVAGVVISFRLLAEIGITLNPCFVHMQKILDKLFNEQWFDGTHSLEEILEEEFRCLVVECKSNAQELIKAESSGQFERVAQLCKVIGDKNVCLVVFDEELAFRVRNHERISYYELQRNSVQIPRYVLEKFHAEKLDDAEELYLWTMRYDPVFLGYMTREVQIIIQKNKK